jgi:ribosomal protein S20/flagellar hook-basal body complex protein FliE
MLGRRLTIPLIITASVVAGGTAGAFLGVPGLSGASTTSPVSTNAAGPTTRGPERKSALFEAAAKALNLTTDELRQKLSDGKTTIADIAKQENIDVNKVIDAMAAADRQRIEDIVNNPLPTRDHGPGQGFGKPFRAEEKFDAAAKALGITTDELWTALRDGKSIAEVAKDKNVDVNKVIDAMVAAAQARIDQAKTDGKITPDQADRLKSELKDRITKIVNGEGGGGPGGPGRGFWGHRGP